MRSPVTRSAPLLPAGNPPIAGTASIADYIRTRDVAAARDALAFPGALSSEAGHG